MYFGNRNVRLVDSPEQLNTRYSADQPKLVLCCPSSLSYGFSRQVLISHFLPSPRSLILLTSSGPSGSLSAHLFDLWNDRQPSATRYGSGKVGEVIDFNAPQSGEAITSSTNVRIKMRKKVILSGEELMTYLEDQRINREKEQKAKAMAERNRRMMEADDANASSESDSSDESDEERDDARAIDADEAGEGTGIGPASFAEPGSGPAMRSGRKGIARYGLEGGMASTGGGAWDEFLDDTKSGNIGGFDIYVRQQSTTTGVHGNNIHSSSMANQTRYKMFPFFERRRKVDGYGEAIDIEGWKTRGKPPEEVEAVLNASEDVLGKRKRAEEDEKVKFLNSKYAQHWKEGSGWAE